MSDSRTDFADDGGFIFKAAWYDPGDYIISPRRVIEDTSLSPEARFTLILILSKPRSWRVSNAWLKHQLNATEYATSKIIRDLAEAGYVRRVRRGLENGKFVWDTYVYDEPQTFADDSEPTIPSNSGDGTIPSNSGDGLLSNHTPKFGGWNHTPNFGVYSYTPKSKRVIEDNYYPQGADSGQVGGGGNDGDSGSGLDADEDVDGSDDVSVLVEYFRHRSGREANFLRPDYEPKWLVPLGKILERVGGDVEAARRVIDRSLEVARGDNHEGKTYQVTSPYSIATIASNLLDEGDAKARVGEADDLWRRAIEAINNQDASDSRLVAAIQAIGSRRITGVSTKDAPALRVALLKKYVETAQP